MKTILNNLHRLFTVSFSKRAVISIACILFASSLLSPAAASVSTLIADTSLSGHVVSTGTVDNSANTFRVGEYPPDDTARGFLHFDISTLPYVFITSAEFRVYQHTVTSTNPYTTLSSNILLDYLDYGTALTGSDYNTTATSELGTISSNSTTEWKTFDITTLIKDAVYYRESTAQFRLRFHPLDNDLVDPIVCSYFIASGDNAPRIVVEWDWADQIPTVGEWGMIILALSLGSGLFLYMIRQKTVS